MAYLYTSAVRPGDSGTLDVACISEGNGSAKVWIRWLMETSPQPWPNPVGMFESMIFFPFLKDMWSYPGKSMSFSIKLSNYISQWEYNKMFDEISWCKMTYSTVVAAFVLHCNLLCIDGKHRVTMRYSLFPLSHPFTKVEIRAWLNPRLGECLMHFGVFEKPQSRQWTSEPWLIKMRCAGHCARNLWSNNAAKKRFWRSMWMFL